MPDTIKSTTPSPEQVAPASQDSPVPTNTPTPSPKNPTVNPPHQESMSHGTSIRTISLIVILAILAGLLLFFALRPMQKSITANKLTPTMTPSPAHSVLSLNPDTQTATQSGLGIVEKKVDVTIESNSNKVSGVQFEISYDPTVLTNVTVKQGDYFSNPIVLLNQVDSKNGKIDYAIGIQPTGQPVSGSGTTAIISYTLLPTATSTQTTLRFLPKTQVVQQGILQSVLEKSIDLVLPVQGLTPSASGNTSAQ